MIDILDLPTAQRTILRRRAWDEIPASDAAQARLREIFGEELSADEAVRRILADVRTRGDAALRDWTLRLDGADRTTFRVDGETLASARKLLSPDVVAALEFAAERIRAFHRKQPALSWIENGVDGTLGQLVRPIERVGIYVPGGQVPLPSSLLMTAIPARVAGVSQVVVASPPERTTGLPHPAILAAAAIAEVDALYVVGGAQAIGALAFGTESIGRVDKICGPGSLFTTLAKRQVYGIVGIDGLPGPTETVVIANESANPEYVAADLLAQAEHVQASAILLTPSRSLAQQVQAEVARQIEELENADIIADSIKASSGIVIVDGLTQAVTVANSYAPEHLCLLVEDPWSLLGDVRCAGGVFLGERSFEVLGDYVAGPSHVMPTGGTARFASPVNVTDFVKIISVIGLNDRALERVGPAAATLAHVEGLTAHAAAVTRRLQGGAA